MPTLTVKQVIQSELLKVCRDVTNKLVEKHDKKKKKAKYTNDEIARMRELIRATGWDEGHTDRWMEIHSILHDAPELKQKDVPMELFCIFVCEKNLSSHRYATNVPFILTDAGANKKGLDLDGTSGSNFGSKDYPRYATEEEVSYCIRNLNDKQMRAIHASDVFKPIMEAAMNKTVTVEDQLDQSQEHSEDNGEVTLESGRVITMAGAPGSD